jgi:hypothetical protein
VIGATAVVLTMAASTACDRVAAPRPEPTENTGRIAAPVYGGPPVEWSRPAAPDAATTAPPEVPARPDAGRAAAGDAGLPRR